jgi:hypothetical protein
LTINSFDVDRFAPSNELIPAKSADVQLLTGTQDEHDGGVDGGDGRA